MLRWITCLVTILSAGAVSAQEYPAKPVRLVSQYAAGGGADVVARILANEFPALVGQQLIVDNRPGANGTLANQIVAGAAPDGYTLLLSGGSSMVINPHVYGKGPIDTLKDFTPIALAVATRFVMVVHSSVPATNLAELTALAKAKPGTLNHGSAGNGSAPHIAGELYRYMAGIDIVHIPYRGMGPAINDLVSGQVQIAFSDPGLFGDFLRNGTLRAIATTGKTRSRIVPDTPTFDESGLKGYEAGTYYAVHGPAGMAPALVDKINLTVRQAMKSTAARTRFAQGDHEPSEMTPTEFAAFQQADYDRWGKLVPQLGLKPD